MKKINKKKKQVDSDENKSDSDSTDFIIIAKKLNEQSADKINSIVENLNKSTIDIIKLAIQKQIHIPTPTPEFN